MTFDCIVVGSGIAGLSFALKVAQAGGTVGIITKKRSKDSNTNYAQGGIACVTSQTDDFELHVNDTLIAGDGLCDEHIVRDIIEEGPKRIQELIDLGVHFTHLKDGRVSLGKEGGHSKRRILHVKDLTGAAIEKALLKAVAQHPKIKTFEHMLAIDIITRARLQNHGLPIPLSENRVLGLYAYDVIQGTVHTLATQTIMLATGGVGHVYQFTTNPDIATGDGIAMAYRAGVAIENMEFVQFHPTAFYTSDDNERFLISEAVRGEGAILRNIRGEAFMPRYHERKDLAPRDIVARAIDQEMKTSGSRHVWLDVSHIPKDELDKRFPNISKHCKRNGIDLPKDFIPVVPAAHYSCGGVACTPHAQTELKGLYACGEVASTGLHGANRLASNSLLEAVVMAHRGAEAVSDFLKTQSEPLPELPVWTDGQMQDSDERVVLLHNLDELKRTMWDYVGIVRTTKRLERARTRIQTLMKEVNEYYWNFKVDRPLLELRNLIQVAELMVKCAQQRKESRGLHHIAEFRQKLPSAQNTRVQRRDR